MRELHEEMLRGNFVIDTDQFGVGRKDIIDRVQNAVAIDASNVHDWKLTDKHQWRDRLPNLPPRPPFPALWVEWVEMAKFGEDPDHFKPFPFGVLVEEYPCWLTEGDEGFLFKRESADPDDEPPSFYAQSLAIFAKIYGHIILLTIIEEDQDREGRAFRCYEKTRDGSLRGLEIPKKLPKEPTVSDWASVRALETYLPMLVFMNCRNVTLNRLTKPARTQKKFQKRYHVRRPSFHVIEVHKSMVRNVYEQGVSDQAVMHAHMVRGHVKHYGEHNKLFGKIVGSWFWQSHVRGDIGTPSVSDYRVWGPNDGHERHCDISRPN